MGRIQLKRAYEEIEGSDGFRVLVERLWPRGVSKKRAQIDHWAKELAPSAELRRWYDHKPERWEEFKARYFAELDDRREAVAAFRLLIGERKVTFVFASRETELNSASALKEYLTKH